MFKNDFLTITNEDNMELMKRYPDNYFDLAICDPEYGLNADKPSKKPNKVKQKNGSILNIKDSQYKHKNWDNKPAGIEYFNELKRVSKNQIIFGVNYYDFNLKGGRLVWDKLNSGSDQMDCEIAYISFNNRTDIVYYLWRGMFQGEKPSKNIQEALKQIGNKSLNEKRIHPTQKPVKLYKWILSQYANQGDKILDTNFGSGSLGIACYDLKFELTACELDNEIYKDSIVRLKKHTNQLQIF